MAIVCFSRSLLFIKTRKTAGTSVQETLLPFCKKGDIVTKEWINILSGNTCKIEEFASIEDIENNFSLSREDYFSFGFTRNPFSLVLSRFFYQIKMKRIPGPPSADYFNRWVEQVYFKGELGFPHGRYVKDRSRYLLFDNFFRPKVNFIGKFENIENDFFEISKKIGLSGMSLQHVNKSNFQNIDYRDWFHEKSADLVRNYFDFELEYFGYTF